MAAAARPATISIRTCSSRKKKGPTAMGASAEPNMTPSIVFWARSIIPSARAPSAEIGALDHLVLGELAGLAREGHAALLHEIEVMRHFQCHVRVLLDQEDGDAVAVEIG